ncbi:hypothetical protein LMG26684_00702 [Achromobacter mucicolens]|uniref:reverse transcriptase family protein n=1 Tax=Achromobacter mucicolens TaxID=1389922 RepID=UPI0014679852|nr:reverse transcriptase family protein [Achromobacter mucicolens]CAB3823411.1 hypothetical protein LMG26684_00702 [Achromobacter mucicolens]
MATRGFYSIDQCALFKLGSKTRLAELLHVPKSHLTKLAAGSDNYRLFELPREVCEFTGKVTKARWVQEPKNDLRQVHERLQKLLARIRPPEYGHAAVKGRSYRTNAAAHVHAAVAATFDIRRFYPSTPRLAVRDFFLHTLRCASDVAELLTTLCCYQDRTEEGAQCGLPTGSPLSPILSLYANRAMFDRLHRFALQHELTFTCYVDDLTFSGPLLPRSLGRFVRKTVDAYGHSLAVEKTKVFRRGQAKHVTGVVIVNNKIKVPNARFKKARAIAAVIQRTASDDYMRLLALQRKLSGLLGEAAFLDPAFSDWARRSYRDLKKINEEAATSTSGVGAAKEGTGAVAFL